MYSFGADCQYCHVCVQIPQIAHIHNSANLPLVFFLEHIGLAHRLCLQHILGRGRGWAVQFLAYKICQEQKIFFTDHYLLSDQI
jgi:hypothetical protein